jgi:hypothetical protein
MIIVWVWDENYIRQHAKWDGDDVFGSDENSIASPVCGLEWSWMGVVDWVYGGTAISLIAIHPNNVVNWHKETSKCILSGFLNIKYYTPRMNRNQHEILVFLFVRGMQCICHRLCSSPWPIMIVLLLLMNHSRRLCNANDHPKIETYLLTNLEFHVVHHPTS